MTIELIPLNRIKANRYQARQHEDPATTEELAISIQRNRDNGSHGLLQIPRARLDPADDQYELILGHRRRSAFALLATKGVPAAGIAADPFFGAMPLEIVEITDQQLYEQMTDENLQREDLTPIELARSIQQYMQLFGATSKQAGQLFGLNESTIRNKLRLLDLTQEAQEQLASGAITEGTARTLLSVQQAAGEKHVNAMVQQIVKTQGRVLPEEVIDTQMNHLGHVVELFDEGVAHGDQKPRAGRGGWLLDMKNFPNELLPELSQVDLALALGIQKDEKLLEQLRRACEEQPTILDAVKYVFPLEKESEKVKKVDHLLHPPACTACAYYTKVRGSHYCGLKLCYERKSEAWAEHELRMASKSLGIAIYQPSDGAYQVLESGYYTNNGSRLFAAKNPGLRLIAKRDVKGDIYQSGYKGVPESHVAVIAVGEAKKKLSASDSRSHPSQTESEKVKQKQERLFRAKRRELVWEFAAIGNELFAGMSDELIDKVMHWKWLGVNDQPPAEWPGKQAGAKAYSEFIRRKLIWCMVESEGLLQHYVHSTSLTDLAHSLRSNARAWGAKWPAALDRLAKDGDAEIAALKAKPKKTVSAETRKKNGELVRQLQGMLHPEFASRPAKKGKKGRRVAQSHR